MHSLPQWEELTALATYSTACAPKAPAGAEEEKLAMRRHRYTQITTSVVTEIDSERERESARYIMIAG